MQIVNRPRKEGHLKNVVPINQEECTKQGRRLKPGCQPNFRARGKTGTEPLTLDLVDGNNLLALTASTPLEEKPCVVTQGQM